MISAHEHHPALWKQQVNSSSRGGVRNAKRNYRRASIFICHIAKTAKTSEPPFLKGEIMSRSPILQPRIKPKEGKAMSNLSMLKKNGEFHTTMDGVFADPDIKEKEDRYNLPYMGRAIVLCGLIIALVWLAVR